MPTPEEEAAAREERRRFKEAEKVKNHARYAEMLAAEERPLDAEMRFADLQAEHGRLRMMIAEMQQLVITGRFDHKLAQEYERRLVALIHRIEERARTAQSGGYVPKPGDATGPQM